MKKLLPIFLILAITMLACNISVNMTPQPGPAATQPSVVDTAVPTTIPSVPSNVSCGHLSLYLNPALGTGYTCVTVPEANAPDAPSFGVNPEYVEVTFQGYPLSGTFFEPHIDLYPVQRYQELAPEPMNERLASLQGLLAGGSPGTSALPLLPFFNAASMFHAQYAVTPFQNGSGIRYLTEYAQYTAPINNKDMFYSFQGLTADGQYWISAILPVSNPILPANGDNPPNGQSFEEFAANYESYVAGITAQLDAQSPDTFVPSLTLLDQLIASILIQP